MFLKKRLGQRGGERLGGYDADITSVTLKKYFDTLSELEQMVLDIASSELLPPFHSDIFGGQTSLEQIKKTLKDGTPCEYWLIDSRNSGGSNGTRDLTQSVEYVREDGVADFAMIYYNSKYNDSIKKGVVATCELAPGTYVGLKNGYWHIVSKSDIPVINT